MARVQRALISVSDKTGVVEFARSLGALGIEILSTGGTARLLAGGAIAVREVADYTGFPEIMDGRVKTLHPRIHGALLGRRGIDDAVMAAHGIEPIDLLVVNLYPFERTVAVPDCTLARAIEEIDVGGPAMLRAAAKNHAAVTVLVDAADYDAVIAELRAGDCAVGEATRRRLAAKVFAHTAAYDGAIAAYLGGFDDDGGRLAFPRSLHLPLVKAADMRYGENPHQRAALYLEPGATGASAAAARQLQGKPLSFNNVADTDAALECVKAFVEPACVIVKHANPCGVAVAEDPAGAYDRAHRTDPTSAFGGIIAFNRTLDGATAEEIVRRQFVEVVIAPEVSEEALAAFAAREGVRVLACGPWPERRPPALDYRRVAGGLLVQDSDHGEVGPADLRAVSRRQPTEAELRDLLFAWRVVKFVKSNAIVFCRDGRTLGVGAGQMSRIYSARVAALKARDEGLDLQGSVLASDAFFPFRDGVDAAAEAGVSAVIEPGGSVRDEEVIAAADEHGLALVFTGMRHFRH